MNWKRITIFTAILYVSGLLVAFLYGFSTSFLHRVGVLFPLWALKIIVIIIFSIISIVVYSAFAKIQKERGFLNVLTVAIILWVLVFPYSAIKQGFPLGRWITSIAYVGGNFIIGYLLGIFMKKRKYGGQNEP